MQGVRIFRFNYFLTVIGGVCSTTVGTGGKGSTGTWKELSLSSIPQQLHSRVADPIFLFFQFFFFIVSFSDNYDLWALYPVSLLFSLFSSVPDIPQRGQGPITASRKEKGWED